MAASFVLHALLLLWVVLFHHESKERPALTEIAWIDEGTAADPGAPAGGGAPKTDPAPADAAIPPQHFRRAERHADLSPVPQSDIALDDRMNTRLAALQAQPRAAAAGAVTPLVAGSGVGAPATLAAGRGAGGSGAVVLRRGGEGAGPALELTRGTGSSGAASPAVVATQLPAEKPAAPSAPSGESAAHRALAGASLMGPVADRAILAQVTPAYPEWAKKEAVEASVTLYFVVRADGTVKENVLVQRTAGFEDFDDSARAALRAWRFQPLAGGHTGEQWGTITFHFRLRDTG